MTAFLVFNELSAATMAENHIVGKKYLDDFADLILDQRIGTKKVLVAPPALLQLPICPGYSVGRWLATYSQADRDRRQRLRLLFDKSIEYGACVPPDDLESAEIEYKYIGRATQGLPTALLADGLAVSLWSDEQWNVPSVDVEKSWLGTQNIETGFRTVPHACRTAHLESHRAWLTRVQSPPPANGIGLWAERAMLFPNLDFCDSVEEHLRPLGGTERRFKAAMRGLQDLQNYCSAWETGNFDIKALVRASGESATTLQRYSEERTFRCPDGQYRVFEWHLKRDDNTRIHFLDKPDGKRILVGYIGPHLRIATE